MTPESWPQSELQARLVAYGLALFRQAAGQGGEAALAEWTAYSAALGGVPDAPPAMPAALASPLAFLQVPPDPEKPEVKRPALPPQVYLRPGLLDGAAPASQPGSLVPSAFPPLQHPGASPDAGETAAALAGYEAQLGRAYADFLAAWERLRTRPGDGAAAFDRFLELYRAYAWAVPAPTARPGVSLYQFFKSICALAVCAAVDGADPAPPAGPLPAAVLLVAGDIPGIQTMIYTVAAAAAAKGLRGRSAYVQLLADAVVRRVRAALDLPAAQVVYAGGGKFLLLAPLALETHLAGIREALDTELLRDFAGDLSVVLAARPVRVATLGTPEFAGEWRAVHADLQTARYRRFAARVAAQTGYDAVFAPRAHPLGADARGVCAVCQKPLRQDDAHAWRADPRREQERREGLAEPDMRCRHCVDFADLARALGRAREVVIRGAGATAPGPWRGYRTCFTIGGYDYDFAAPGTAEPAGLRLWINRANFWDDADGFWQIANTTPFVTTRDVELDNKRHPTAPPKEWPAAGDVKDFHLLADDARGVKRVGVLRMDVDNLGTLLTQGFGRDTADGTAPGVGAGDPALTLPALATLSQILSLFFDTRVPILCADVDAAGQPQGEQRDFLYVIYSGGDDLFVVGPWDRTVTLAQQVHAAFAVYTGTNPYLGLSGAVTLEGAKFPLYRAAQRAGAAEDAAKDHRRAEESSHPEEPTLPRPWSKEKDAFAFLGQVVGWDEFAVVTRWQDRFCRWIGQSGPDTTQVPRALMQLVIRIHALHRETRRVFYMQHRAAFRAYLDARRQGIPAHRPRRFARNRVYHGRWLWMLSYSLTRFAHRMPRGALRNEVEAAIKELQADVLRPRMIELVGLAARWAELLLRNKEDRA